MKAILLLTLLSTNVYAFVSGPGSVNAGENQITLSNQAERGKIEPNENRTSFQDAQIDIMKLKYTRGFDGMLGFESLNLFVEAGSFTSNKEQVGATVFYDKDQGSFATIGLAGDILHELDKQFGLYLQVTPSRNYNKSKFSNPRLDSYAFGVTSAFNITDNLFQKNLIHFGSGDGTSQNSYIAIDTGLGYKLDQFFNRQITLTGSLFLEADTAERHDASYDAAFSATGTQDRIRAFKYGTLFGADVAITNQINLGLSSLQKQGGYDARSTQILNVNVGVKF